MVDIFWLLCVASKSWFLMSLRVDWIWQSALLATDSEELPRFSVSETVERALLSLRRTVAIEK